MLISRRSFVLTGLAAPAVAATSKRQVERPNVVLIVASDIGAYMLGCYGSKEIRTPNIDQFSKTGVLFSKSFSTSPVTQKSSIDEARIAQALGGAGYACGKGLEFLDAQTPHKPFFASIAWPSPSTVTPAAKLLDLYAATQFEATGFEQAAANAVHKEMLIDVRGNLRKFAAAVTMLDDQMSAVLAKLQQRGLWDNTAIVFTSNNGYLLGRHGLWGDGQASRPVNLYNEVVATPLIWSWPSSFPPDSIRTEVVGSHDLLPTLCDLAGAATAVPGWSYLPILYGRHMSKKQVWQEMAYSGFQDTEMARDDRYKLILRAQGKGPNELYDEAADPQERVNQVDNLAFSSVRQRLAGEINAWRGRKSG
jgi:arylsulfatase A-like enzyme